MMKRLIFSALLVVSVFHPCLAEMKYDSCRIFTLQDCMTLATGTMLVTGGILGHSSDYHYAQSQISGMNHHSSAFDDACRFLPTVARLSMRLSGLEGKSQFNRYVISRIGAYGATVALTEGLKRIVSQPRPDRSSNKSTPSGHAALAFMSAAVITEEYGYLTPFIPLGAYTVSSWVGFSRMLGNHHYASDVLLGAGIGLLATKASYLLTDIFLKGKGKNRVGEDTRPSLTAYPSYVGLFDAYSIPLNDVSLSGHTFSQKPGLTIGLSGTWYFHPLLGVTARITETRHFLMVDEIASNTPLDRFTPMVGLAFSYPVGTVRIGGEVMEGYSWQTSHFPSLRATGMCPPEGVTRSAGINVQMSLHEHLGMRFQVDYETISSTKRISYLQPAISLHYSL